MKIIIIIIIIINNALKGATPRKAGPKKKKKKPPSQLDEISVTGNFVIYPSNSSHYVFSLFWRDKF